MAYSLPHGLKYVKVMNKAYDKACFNSNLSQSHCDYLAVLLKQLHLKYRGVWWVGRQMRQSLPAGVLQKVPPPWVAHGLWVLGLLTQQQCFSKDSSGESLPPLPPHPPHVSPEICKV